MVFRMQILGLPDSEDLLCAVRSPSPVAPRAMHRFKSILADGGAGERMLGGRGKVNVGCKPACDATWLAVQTP